jgi:hypothetical protein
LFEEESYAQKGGWAMRGNSLRSVLRRCRTLGLVLSVILLPHTVTARDLVPAYAAMREAYQAGSLSAVAYVELVVQALRDPGALDSRWMTEQPGIGICLTPIMRDVWDAARDDPEAREALRLLTRPGKQASFVSQDGLFTIHYDTTGTHAVRDPEVDVDPTDGVPDFVNRCAEAFDYSWHFEVDTLGYDPPGSDCGLGGSDNYDVYMHSSGVTGWAQIDEGMVPPEYPDRPGAVCTHIWVDPTYEEWEDLVPPLDHLQVIAAHELFHAVQGIYNWYIYSWSWAEQTAMWMQDLVYDDVDEHELDIILPAFFDHPHEYLYSYYHAPYHFQYAACVWPMFLEHHFGRDVMRQAWVECIPAEADAPQAVDMVLQGLGSSQAEEVAEFRIWNYFTGERDDGQHYEEGADWPLVHVMTEHTAFPVLDAGPLSGQHPGGLACNYIRFQGVQDYVNLQVDFSDRSTAPWDWAVRFIIVDDGAAVYDSMEVVEGQGTAFLDLGGADTVIMIPTCLEPDDIQADYSYSVWPDVFVVLEEFHIADLGNGDGRAEPGESFCVGGTFTSIVAEWDTTCLMVRTEDPDLAVLDSMAVGGSVAPGDTFEIPAETILLQVESSCEPHVAAVELVVGPAGGDPVATFDVDLLLGMPPLLVMDDDGGGSVQSYVTASLDSLGLVHDVWDDHAGMYPAFPLAALDLAAYDEVIWLTGDAGNALSPADIDSIAAILQNDGHLFLSGQDIAESLATTPQGTQFMEQWLGVQYDGYESGLRVNGAEGDPLYGGMPFVTAGGAMWDGANNQTSRDRLSALPEADVCLEYLSGYPAAVRRDWGQARLIFAGFGVEAVLDDMPNFSSRRQFLSIALDYLENGITHAGDPPVPQQLRLLSVWPNPTSRNVFARLSGAGGNVEVYLTNLVGRRVASLFSRASGDRGETVIAFRVPPAVPTGRYILQLRSQSATEAVPLSVVR